MKKILLFLLVIQCSLSYGQIFIDDFDDGIENNTFYAGTGFTSSEMDGEWTVNGDGTGGPFDPFGYAFQDETGASMSLDITGNNSIFVRAKASNLGTSLRMDVKDADGFVSTVPGVVKTLVNDYAVFEFNYTGNLTDGGFGGTACDTGPCPVDGTRIVELNFFVNPGIGAWAGTVKIDFISVGEEPQVGPMSDVFQDQFEDAVSLNYLGQLDGYTNVIENGQWNIVGDGTNPMWNNVNMLFYNTTTLDTTDISLANGDDKLFIRMRTDVPGTTVRVDIQDINSFASTAGSITKLISDEWTTYEYNYAGSYQDLAFGGTGCEVGPCDLDADRIENMILFINPGVEGFVGQVEIDYISVGTALEAVDPSANTLEYGDHFSQDYEQVNTVGAFDLSIEGSELTISGSGVDAPFAAVAVSVHDEGAGETVNATGNNKVFLRVKSDAVNTLLRVDLVDTSGFVTTQPSFTRLLDEEYSVLEIDFSAAYIDAGYGGTSCEVGPCPLDAEAINTILLYPNPVDGGFDGNITVDYISFGAPMGEDVPSFEDHFDDENRDTWSEAGGFTVSETGTELTIVGDGTAGAYTAFEYAPLDPSGNPINVDLTSNNKIFLKVKSTVAAPLRIDLVDEGGFATTEPATVRAMTEEYSILEFDYTGTYSDGGYGGTSCDMGPCAVDGEAVVKFLVYIDPDNGAYAGTTTIDWFSIIEPLEAIVDTGGPLGVDDYFDEFDGDISNIEGEAGIEVSGDGSTLKVTGDGTSGAFTPFAYGIVSDGDSIIVNAVANDNKLYIRAKSTAAETALRIDLVDNMDFHTTVPGVQNNIGTEYSVIEYSYAGNYNDGGYGGTACETGPCQVDGKRIGGITFYLNPGEGAFDGEFELDWISFGEPLTVSVVDLDIAESGKIYPNPSNGELYLELETKVSGKLNATITDLQGRVLSNINLGNAVNGNNSSKISINNLASGMYILGVTIDGKPAYNQKIVKL